MLTLFKFSGAFVCLNFVLALEAFKWTNSQQMLAGYR